MEKLNTDRVHLTKNVMSHFLENIYTGEVSSLSDAMGLSYTLIYNLVHGRIHSLSVADYRRIFGEDPPRRLFARVDGRYFRAMVELWLFLHDEITEKDLYREYYKGKRSLKKIDYRIFSGSTKTVEAGLEKMMERKFLEQGLDREEIMEWIQDLNLSQERERVPYEQAKPGLDYLQKHLDASPSYLLNQHIKRYESGKLKSISRKRYDSLVELKERTAKAVAAGSRLEMERIREEVYGGREGYILFSEVEEEIDFLRKHARKGPKRYLNRSIGPYKRGKLKRIDARRAHKILEDCDMIIRDNRLVLGDLPRRYQRQRTNLLLSVLKKSMFDRISDGRGDLSEEGVLMPGYRTSIQYKEAGNGFVPIDQAARLWGMSERAFDLLIARHINLLKKIAQYREGWLLPEQYLKETANRKGFSIIKEKYEWLAGQGGRP